MLTLKKEQFCQAVAKGEDLGKAYAEIFKKPISVDASRQRGMRLAKKPEIVERVDELKTQIKVIQTENFGITAESVLAELQEIKEMAKRKNWIKVQMKALKEQAIIAGVYVTKSETVEYKEDVSLDEIHRFTAKFKQKLQNNAGK